MNGLQDNAHNHGQDVELVPVQQSIQILPPGSQNKINWNFGGYLLALKAQSPDVQRSLLRQFQRQTQSIVHKKGLFHPSGPQEWESLTNEIIAKEVGKFEHCSVDEIQDRRANNGFAYMYKALANGAIDEVRKLVRRPKEIRTDAKRFAFTADRIGLRTPHPDKVLERDELIGLILATRGQYIDNRGILAVLDVMTQLLTNPEPIEGANYRASIVSAIAESARVSPQQARTYLRQFQKRVQSDVALQAISDELRFLAPAPRIGTKLCGDGLEESSEKHPEWD